MSYTDVPTNVRSLEQRLANEPELLLANDLAELFIEVGLPTPKPIPVMRTEYQIAQKLHAVSSKGSERARDLVDLQLLARDEDLDFRQLRATCLQLFRYRQQQEWPPTITTGERWDTLYTGATKGLLALPTVQDAAVWANHFVQRIASADESDS